MDTDLLALGSVLLGSCPGQGLDRQRAVVSPDIIWFAFASLKCITAMYSCLWKVLWSSEPMDSLVPKPFNTKFYKKNPQKWGWDGHFCWFWVSSLDYGMIVFNNFTRLPSQRTQNLLYFSVWTHISRIFSLLSWKAELRAALPFHCRHCDGNTKNEYFSWLRFGYP